MKPCEWWVSGHHKETVRMIPTRPSFNTFQSAVGKAKGLLFTDNTIDTIEGCHVFKLGKREREGCIFYS